ncbi:ProP effector [Paraburkholderia sp. HC6.4b]|uniref:ProQ/FinO family protein n=1 Tax=unclassified Paraburkholderia TaxID=2615204 RepID=UPI001609042A|nr:MULTISPECIES: ProQ/FinO family protein [unclassified Paraburkholderia]MBB5413283.1 ProP effector [Paraburkholderia sp. HC6.4b]MBB5455564.1 ProP effector [Paraburkholderia sp. Kb1A]
MGFEQLAELKKQLAAARAAAESAGKPDRKSAARPASKSAGKPASNSAAHPGSHAERGANPGTKPGGRPGAKPAAKAGARPDGKPGTRAGGPQPARHTASAKPAVDAKPVDPVVRSIGRLQKRFPVAFPKNPAPKLPLKIGIFEDLVVHAKEVSLSEAELRDAIKTWCRGGRYWKSLVEGAARVDLAGVEAGKVTAQEAAGAQRLLAHRAAKGAQKTATATASANAPTDASTPAEGAAAEAPQAEAGVAAVAEQAARQADAAAASPEAVAADAAGSADTQAQTSAQHEPQATVPASPPSQA